MYLKWRSLAPHFGWIFKFKPKLELVVIGLDFNSYNVGTNLERQILASSILGTCKGSNSFTLVHQNCKLNPMTSLLDMYSMRISSSELRIQKRDILEQSQIVSNKVALSLDQSCRRCLITSRYLLPNLQGPNFVCPEDSLCAINCCHLQECVSW